MSNIQLAMAFIRMGEAIRRRQGIFTGRRAMAFLARLRSTWLVRGPEKNRHERRKEASEARRERRRERRRVDAAIHQAWAGRTVAPSQEILKAALLAQGRGP